MQGEGDSGSLIPTIQSNDLFHQLRDRLFPFSSTGAVSQTAMWQFCKLFRALRSQCTMWMPHTVACQWRRKIVYMYAYYGKALFTWIIAAALAVAALARSLGDRQMPSIAFTYA